MREYKHLKKDIGNTINIFKELRVFIVQEILKSKR